MDPAGHEKASLAGVEELLLAVAKCNPHLDEIRTNAFYLGNWLTDKSQFIVLEWLDGAAKWLTDLVRSIFGMLKRGLAAVLKVADVFREGLRAADDFLPKLESLDAVLSKLEKLGLAPDWSLEELGDDIYTTVDEYLERLAGWLNKREQELCNGITWAIGSGKDSAVAKIVKAYYTVDAYFKFVHPTSSLSRDRMNYQAFLRIVDEQFTAYYAHEHVDRPSVDPAQGEGSYPERRSSGPRRPQQGRSCTPDMYEYMRDDIHVVAGILADIDLCWASETFDPTATTFGTAAGKGSEISDDDLDWNLQLARLGHALHLVEDFYAHSTFVELTVGGVPKLSEEARDEDASRRLARRLLRWDRRLLHDENLATDKLAPEDHVVSGFFDGQDTAVSVIHHLEGLLPETIFKTLEDYFNEDYKKLFDHAGKLIRDPLGEWNRNLRPDGDVGYNEVAKRLKEHGGDMVERALSPDILDVAMLAPRIGDMIPVLKDRPEIQFWIATVIVEAAQVRDGLQLYSLIKDIVLLARAPALFLEELLKDFALKEGIKLGLDLLLNQVVKLLEQYFGAERVGSHSLISKDHEESPFYEGAMSCATATHWYVAHTLLRHAREEEARITRSTPDKKSFNVLYLERWYDWLEVLEFFLDNPQKNVEVELVPVNAPMTMIHTVGDGAEETLADLLDRYAVPLERFLEANYTPDLRSDPAEYLRFVSCLIWSQAKPGARSKIPRPSFPRPTVKRDALDIRIEIPINMQDEGEYRKQGAWEDLVRITKLPLQPGTTYLFPSNPSMVCNMPTIRGDTSCRWWYGVLQDKWEYIKTWATKEFPDESSEVSCPLPELYVPTVVKREDVIQLIQGGEGLRSKLEGSR